MGVMELTFAALFVVPATMARVRARVVLFRRGDRLELSHDALKANRFIPIVLLWISAFVRSIDLLLSRTPPPVGLLYAQASGRPPLTPRALESDGRARVGDRL